jgi:hypothetical protein
MPASAPAWPLSCRFGPGAVKARFAAASVFRRQPCIGREPYSLNPKGASHPRHPRGMANPIERLVT